MLELVTLFCELVFSPSIGPISRALYDTPLRLTGCRVFRHPFRDDRSSPHHSPIDSPPSDPRLDCNAARWKRRTPVQANFQECYIFCYLSEVLLVPMPFSPSHLCSAYVAKSQLKISETEGEERDTPVLTIQRNNK